MPTQRRDVHTVAAVCAAPQAMLDTREPSASTRVGSMRSSKSPWPSCPHPFQPQVKASWASVQTVTHAAHVTLCPRGVVPCMALGRTCEGGHVHVAARHTDDTHRLQGAALGRKQPLGIVAVTKHTRAAVAPCVQGAVLCAGAPSIVRHRLVSAWDTYACASLCAYRQWRRSNQSQRPLAPRPRPPTN